MPGKILVVDSDATTRHQTIAALLPAGYQLAVAEDPLEASNTAVLESPDLVLLGDSMVFESGLAIVGRLFSAPSTAPLPVLIVANTPEKQAAAERSGARAVIAGPVSAQGLLAFVAEHIDVPGPLAQAPAALLNDSERLAAVAAIRADLSGETNLTRFTQLASEMLEVPVSTITLVDQDEQVFVNAVGIGDNGGSSDSSPLEYSYCQFAVTSRAPLRISDAKTHPLVENIPSLGTLDVASYLGIPLIMANDQAVGTLCVIDTEPRDWTDDEVSILNDLAGILTAQLNSIVGTSGRHSAP